MRSYLESSVHDLSNMADLAFNVTERYVVSKGQAHIDPYFAVIHLQDMINEFKASHFKTRHELI